MDRDFIGDDFRDWYAGVVGTRLIVGCLMLAVTALVAGVNFYLCWLRYPLHQWRGRQPPQFVSGIPVIGTGFLVVALALLWDQQWIIPVAAALGLVDPCGLPWVTVILLWQMFLLPIARYLKKTI